MPKIPLEPWQYRLTTHPHTGGQTLGKYWLSIGPDLPRVRVTDENGVSFGVLLGFAIDLNDATLVREVWQAPTGADLMTDAGIYRALRALGGRYLWIYVSGDKARIYPDAVTQVTCVWDRQTQSAGSTSLAILDAEDYAARFDKPLFDRLKVLGEGWFPAGLTAHDGVERLLPNHYLDLATWTAHRFAAVTITGEAAPATVIDEVVSAVQTQVKALLTGTQSPVIALTAGRESRAVLACLREWTNELQFVTVTGEDRHQTDTVIAQRIAADLGIAHIMLRRKVADQQHQDLFLRRSGHCFGDSNMQYHPSVHPLHPDHVFAGGLGGEIARAFFWRGEDTADMAITPSLLMARFGLPQSDKVERALQIWLDGLHSAMTAQDILDRAYLELRLGPWAMAQFCADPKVVRYAPMITYDTVASMLALPAQWKAEKRLNAAIVDRLWPELHRYPYNTLGKFMDIWVRVQRVLDNPAILIKKLRQRRS